ncbi:MAG TPA: hypothetical protein VIS72_10155 [Anaerolineales bacterium]
MLNFRGVKMSGMLWQFSVKSDAALKSHVEFKTVVESIGRAYNNQRKED